MSRIIPILLLSDGCLIKTQRFRNDFCYIGDPSNSVRVFNEIFVDELVILDIGQARGLSKPSLGLLKNIFSEAFIPLSYGGGIKNIELADEIFSIGVEKVIINSELYTDYKVLGDISKRYGRQAVVASIDYRYRDNRFVCVSKGGLEEQEIDLFKHMQNCIDAGAGELLLQAIDRDGVWKGLDRILMDVISEKYDVPVVVAGGCSGSDDIQFARQRGLDVGAGSLFVFQKPGCGVLISYPTSLRQSSFDD